MKLVPLKEERNVSHDNLKSTLSFNILDENPSEDDGNESDDCLVIPEEPFPPTNIVPPLSLAKCDAISKQINIFSLTEEDASKISTDKKNSVTLAISFKNLLMTTLPRAIAWYFLHQYLPEDLRMFNLSNISKFETIFQMGVLDQQLKKFITEFNDKETKNPLYLNFQESVDQAKKVQTRKQTARKSSSYNYLLPGKFKKDKAILEENNLSSDDVRIDKRRKLTKPNWSVADQQSENEAHLKKLKTSDSLPTSYDLHQANDEEQPQDAPPDTETTSSMTDLSMFSSSPQSSIPFVTLRPSSSSSSPAASTSSIKKKTFQPGVIWIKPDPDVEVSVIPMISVVPVNTPINTVPNPAVTTSNDRFNSIEEFSFQRCITLASHRNIMNDIKKMKTKMLAEYTLETIMEARENVEVDNYRNLYLFTVTIHHKIDVLDKVKKKQVLNQLLHLDQRLSIYTLLVIQFDLVFSSEFKPLHAINRAIADVTAKDKHDKVRVCQLLEQVYNLVPDQHLINCRYFLHSNPTSLIAMESILDKRLTSFPLNFTVDILMRYIKQNLMMTSCNRYQPGPKDLDKYGVRGEFLKLATFVQNYEENCTTPTEYNEYKLILEEFIANRLHLVTNMCVTLTKNDFQEKLCDFRSESHCSLDVSVVVVTMLSNVKRSHKNRKLTEVTLEFLNGHFDNDCHISLKKQEINSSIVDQFKMGKVTGKRSLVSCGDTLKGVALHLIDLKLQSEGGDKKRANNKFSHYQRKSRSAGDKLTNDYAEKYGLDVRNYNYDDIEEKMQVSLMIFNKIGYLVYCSKELKPTNCVFYDTGEGMFLVKERFVRAFGSFYHTKPKKAQLNSPEYPV